MNVILSIKPKFCEKIINGDKSVEFRRRIFNANKIKSVYMYSTSPIKKIVGTFKIDSIVVGSPIELWRKFKQFSGIDEYEFFQYFGLRKMGFAIKIKAVEPYDPPIDPHTIIPNFIPPRSFRYIKSVNFLSIEK